MSKELDTLITKIEKVYTFNEFTQAELSKTSIKKHYDKNAIGFKYFHSFDGCVHMGISENETFHKTDFYTQVQRIASQIRKQSLEKNSNFKVLELGCGKGFNISYLAREFPDINFVGIDICAKHLSSSKKKVKALTNVEIVYMDFDTLDFKPDEFNLIYAIESICYSFFPEKLSKNIYAILKNKGYFISFDLLRNSAKKPSTIQEEKLVKYIEASVSINKVIENESWLKIVRSTGFEIIKNDDLSENILPNLTRLNCLAKKYYHMYFLTKVIDKLIPKPLAKSSIASYLLKYSIENNFHMYTEIALKK